MNDNYKYRFGKVVYDLNAKTYIMGILNVTPDSFSDGGKFIKTENAVAHALKMVQDGADFIDIGGQSSRPGADEVSTEEELNRVIPVIKLFCKESNIPVSIDTCRSAVAEEALNNGACMVNDISALNHDSDMAKVIGKHKASCILMHMKGTPKNMQSDPQYENLTNEILSYLEKSIWKANTEGIDQIIVDPGFGFGKDVSHNLLLIKNLSQFKKLDCPVMMGISRKSTIGKILKTEIDGRLEGTLALNAIAIINGANILRVHDITENIRVARIVDEYKTIK
jgi:dihydropteroate synthase